MSVRPKRELGQHWLVDENILGVIGRLAELELDDVVLEVGPGLGVLTAYLADHVRLVHALELDRALEPKLRERLSGRSNIRVAFGDALTFPFPSLEPPPEKLVSNLPYNVATPIVVESLARLPMVDRWCVMVQREIADRFFAAPGTKEYGAVSVVVQLSTERTGFHPVSRTCFLPPPRVDSALVAFRRKRTWAGDLDQARRVAQAAFAHRRKTIVNSLELAGFDPERVAVALAARGVSPRERAEVLAPEEFAGLAELLV